MNFGMVSCVIPTYKRSDTLIKSIKSILGQNYTNLEVLVVDDNEPGDKYSKLVKEKIASIGDFRVKYIAQRKHINGAAARNAGMRAASGEYIAFLDDDDEWLPSKLEEQIKYLENHKEIEGVSTLYTIFSNEKPVRKCPPYTGENLHLKVLSRSVSVFTSTVLLKRKALNDKIWFDESLLRHQDLQFLLDFLKDNKMAVLNKYLVKLHVDESSNRPDTKKLIDIKNLFFKRVIVHLEMYNKKQRKRIYSAHYFEVLFAALKEKKLYTVLSLLLKIGVDFVAYKDVISRFYERKKYKVS